MKELHTQVIEARNSNMKYKDIAEQFSIPLNTVKTIIRRSKLPKVPVDPYKYSTGKVKLNSITYKFDEEQHIVPINCTIYDLPFRHAEALAHANDFITNHCKFMKISEYSRLNNLTLSQRDLVHHIIKLSRQNYLENNY